ncbi:MAG TPA: squalene synthase HpnC [Polyangia bacterium]|jgi:squalene synthase HpnC|nr:squalene synthase HpnC [Polyangia bacterium]
MIRQILRGGRDLDRPVAVSSADEPAGSKTSAPVSTGPIPWLDAPAGPWTVERAYGYCEEFARAHTERFPVASRLVPAEMRPHLIALYAFARLADDFADEPQYEGRRIEALDRWEAELHRCFHGEATHPVFIALAETIERRDLPLPPLEDMLTAFRMDLDVKRYATFQALRGYTMRSADPVGRLLLSLFGYRQPELFRYADEISTALQLTNFWQDVAADAARGHIYIPAEDLHFFGLTEADVRALKPSKPLRDLLRFQVARTRALYEHGRPLLDLLGNDLRMELTLIWLIGTAILDKIEAADHDVFSRRPEITRRDKAVIMARAAKHWATHLDLGALRRLWP